MFPGINEKLRGVNRIGPDIGSGMSNGKYKEKGNG